MVLRIALTTALFSLQDHAAASMATANARVTRTRVLPYPVDQIWPATLRYLRVDRGFAVVDRDREGGFILFEFPVGVDRVARGSVEFIEKEDVSGRPSAQVQVSTEGGATHLPFSLLEGIAAKVKTERGGPAPPPPPPPKEKEDPPLGEEDPLEATDPEDAGR